MKGQSREANRTATLCCLCRSAARYPSPRLTPPPQIGFDPDGRWAGSRVACPLFTLSPLSSRMTTTRMEAGPHSGAR
jgi:hypothetical protein